MDLMGLAQMVDLALMVCHLSVVPLQTSNRFCLLTWKIPYTSLLRSPDQYLELVLKDTKEIILPNLPIDWIR